MVHLNAVIKCYDAQRRPDKKNTQENKDHSQPVRHCPNIVLSKRNLKLGRGLCVVRPTIRQQLDRRSERFKGTTQQIF
jgi:hypothetical protein